MDLIKEITLKEQRKIALERNSDVIKAKKTRNRSLLSMAILFIGLTSVALSIGNSVAETGAKSGPIHAKSELSTSQVKALNVMPAQPEHLPRHKG